MSAFLFAHITLAATIVVNTANDSENEAGECSLRDAINSINNEMLANGCDNTGAAFGEDDTIEFNILGGGPHVLILDAQLPTIEAPSHINGLSQEGASCDLLHPENNSPGIVIDGDYNVDTAISIEINHLLYGFNDDTLIEGLSFTGMNGRALESWNTSNLIVRCNNFYHNDYGIEVDENKDSFIESNYFYQNNTVLSFVDSQNIIIQNNYAIDNNNGMYISSASPLPPEPSENITFLNNHIENIDGEAVSLRRLSHVDFLGNTIINAGIGILVADNDNITIGGPLESDRNIIFETETGIDLFAVEDIYIENNYIGLDETGLVAQTKEMEEVISFTGDVVNTIIHNNYIYGFADEGLGVLVFLPAELIDPTGINTGFPQLITITDNHIGYDINGNIIEPKAEVSAIFIIGAAENFLIKGNTIATNPGVLMVGVDNESPLTGQPISHDFESIQSIDISENSFDAEFGVLIMKDFQDLIEGNIFPTTNDPFDADTGPNNLQNYPVITSATIHNDGTVTITYEADFRADDYRIEFYRDSEASIFNTGIGSEFITSHIITHQGDGPETFQVALPAIEGDIISATATPAFLPVISGAGTSEFGIAFAIEDPTQPQQTTRRSSTRLTPAQLASMGITTTQTQTLSRNDRILTLLANLERDADGRVTQNGFIQFIMGLIQILQ